MGRRPYAPYRYSLNDKELTKRFIEEMNLTEFSERAITSLSGGEQQKTFFTRSLVQSAKNMLLDEPFNNLDPYYQIGITKKLIELKNEKSIVIVLHDISMIHYFDRVIMIKNGGIMKDILINDLNCELLKMLFDIDFMEYYGNKDKIYMPVV
jgi:ABC-type cobalamin/Fe3+-siderophores transport system ATPase subunit